MTTTPHLDNTSRHEARVSPARPEPRYEVQVAGHLDDHWSDWLGIHTLVRNDDATTTLTCDGLDQAQLHGVLAAIRDIGASLLSLQRIDEHSVIADDTHGDNSDGTAAVPILDRVLRTSRLSLRSAAAADADATWAYRRLESVNEWLTGVPESREAYRDMFAEASRLATTVIVERVADKGDRPVVVGDFMLRLHDAWAQAEVADRARGVQAELGWVLDPQHTGVGYATEAVRELLRYCFGDLGVHRVVANCFLENQTSWRLLERVGMRREAHAVAESLHRSGRWLDTVCYAVLADEWTRRLP